LRCCCWPCFCCCCCGAAGIVFSRWFITACSSIMQTSRAHHNCYAIGMYSSGQDDRSARTALSQLCGVHLCFPADPAATAAAVILYGCSCHNSMCCDSFVGAPHCSLQQTAAMPVDANIACMAT
jgi:hypothetical protein